MPHVAAPWKSTRRCLQILPVEKLEVIRTLRYGRYLYYLYHDDPIERFVKAVSLVKAPKPNSKTLRLLRFTLTV